MWTGSGALMIYLGDCRTELKHVEAASVACVVTSPPFWTAHGGTEWGGEDSAPHYLARVVVLATALRRVLRPGGTFWLVLGDRLPWATLHALAEVDWHVSGVSAWGTSVVAQLHRTKTAPRHVADPYGGVVTDQPYTPLARQFVRQCLQSSTVPGDLVLDPCCGTGTVGVEAAALKRRFVGIEIDPASCALARARTH
jgi:DNA modification methylase